MKEIASKGDGSLGQRVTTGLLQWLHCTQTQDAAQKVSFVLPWWAVRHFSVCDLASSEELVSKLHCCPVFQRILDFADDAGHVGSQVTSVTDDTAMTVDS